MNTLKSKAGEQMKHLNFVVTFFLFLFDALDEQFQINMEIYKKMNRFNLFELLEIDRKEGEKNDRN